MSNEFFKQVPPEEWEKLKKDGFAEEYDANELKHAHALDHVLTLGRFDAIMEEKDRQDLQKAAEKSAVTFQKISQKLQSKNPNDRKFSEAEVLEVKHSLSEALNLIDRVLTPEPSQKLSPTKTK